MEVRLNPIEFYFDFVWRSFRPDFMSISCSKMSPFVGLVLLLRNRSASLSSELLIALLKSNGQTREFWHIESGSSKANIFRFCL
mmetsp:Transcript_2997/g.5293  ORF Transcript_2997/g.5293 Transcript_2997/m.5293 type:complete len:84 (-) Transcript_2997:416-667(-)